jgi:hypothetical protein
MVPKLSNIRIDALGIDGTKRVKNLFLRAGLQRAEGSSPGSSPTAMPEPLEGLIVSNLVEALNRLHEDLSRVELWTAALQGVRRPAPDYGPPDQYLLPTRNPTPR